jgi:hypothetical protein
MCQWAKKARSMRELDAVGMDIQGILKAIRSLPGVLVADVGTTDETKFADRYSAHFVYHPNTYINITFVPYPETQKKVAASGAEGLQGRTFESVRKCFRVPIKDSETFSDGKPLLPVFIAQMAKILNHECDAYLRFGPVLVDRQARVAHERYRRGRIR